jgi:hypothetical protein
LIAAVCDVLALRFFVPGAVPQGLSPRELLNQVKHTVSFGGVNLSLYYGLTATVLLGVVVLAPRLSRSRPQAALFPPWVFAWFALFAMATSQLFALSRSRSDLVYFPLLFFALFLCAAIEIVLRLAWPRTRFRFAAAATIGVLLVISLGASLSASWRIQQSMSRWSIQTLALNGSFVYGEYARRASIPTSRRHAVHQDLMMVGIQTPEAWDEAVRALCLNSKHATSRILIPAEFAWNDDWVFDCAGQPQYSSSREE